MSPFWRQMLSEAIVLSLSAVVVLLIHRWRNPDDGE